MTQITVPKEELEARAGAPRRERGMTTLGFLILAVFVGLFAFAVIQLTPVYLNYMKVASVMTGVQEEFDGQSPTIADIRDSIDRRFGIESVSVIEARDLEIVPDQNGYRIEAEYDHSVSFIGNISFTVHFEKDAVVRR